MANPIWPPELPQLQSEQTEFWEAPDLVRSEMSTGPSNARRRGTRRNKFFRTPMEMRGSQVDVFYDFVDSLGGGVLPFDWTNPVDDSTATVKIRDISKHRLVLGAKNASDRIWDFTITLEFV